MSQFDRNGSFGERLGDLLLEAGVKVENMPSGIPEFTVESFVEYIDEMLNDTGGRDEDSRYRFAFDTLEGIRGTVVDTDRVTDRQIEAVVNIRSSVKDPL